MKKPYILRGSTRKLHILCVSLMPFMICSGMIYSVFSLYLFELGMSRTQIGIIYTVSSLSGIVFAPIFGKLSDRVGRKPIILLSIASFALVFFLYSLSRSLVCILSLEVLGGSMWAAFSVVTPALITDMAKERERGEYLGLYNQAWYVGWAIGPFLGGFLADSIGFQRSFIICSGILLIGLVLTLYFVREP